MSKWLQAIGMDHYTSNFVDNGFATPRQILELKEEDLEALGVTPIDQRKKILKAINNTKKQVSKYLRSYQRIIAQGIPSPFLSVKFLSYT